VAGDLGLGAGGIFAEKLAEARELGEDTLLVDLNGAYGAPVSGGGDLGLGSLNLLFGGVELLAEAGGLVAVVACGDELDEVVSFLP